MALGLCIGGHNERQFRAWLLSSLVLAVLVASITADAEVYSVAIAATTAAVLLCRAVIDHGRAWLAGRTLNELANPHLPDYRI